MLEGEGAGFLALLDQPELIGPQGCHGYGDGREEDAAVGSQKFELDDDNDADDEKHL